MLSMCHDKRNSGEYEGTLDIDRRIVSDLTDACEKVAATVQALGPPRAQ